MSDQDQAICSIHQQPSIAVDLSPSVQLEQKFLCINCVAPQFANHIILNSQFKEQMNDFKQKEFENKKQLYELKLENCQQLCAKLQGYLDYINGSLNKILVQMNQQIEKLKNQMSNITQPKDQILKEDLILYIQSLQQETNENEELNSTNDLEKECDFLKLILEQFQKLQFKDQHNEIIKQIQQIMSQKIVNKEQIQILQPTKYKDDQSQKTLSLDYSCNRHGKEIIMTTLECDYKDERLFCAECLPDVKVQLTTLKEANNQWLIHQGKVYDSNNIFLNQREQRQSKTLEIITSYQQSNKQLQNEMIQLLQKQNEIVQNDILNLEQTKNKQSLMQLDIKMVKTAINTLSQKEQLTQAIEFQQKLKLEDQQFEKELLNKLNEIEQIQINCKKHFQQLLNNNELLELDILINKFKIECHYNQLDSRIFMVLIPQLQNEIFNVFKEIWKQTIVKGQHYIGYLQKQEQNSNDQIQQEKQNLQKYQSLQTQFEKQFILLVRNKTEEDKSFQTNLNLTINSQIIKFSPNKLKQGKIQVNQTNQTIQNLCVNNKIFAVATKIIKKNQFQPSQIKGVQFSYPYTKFNQPLKFSTTLKHSGITISADGKTAQQSTGAWYLCLCDQPIPKNGTVVVDFKVKQIYSMMAGICLKDSYNKDYTDSHRKDKGCYFLYTYPGNSYVYSHHDPNKQCVQQGFLFEKNDIISMEVNIQSKQLSWRNKAKNHVYSIDIQTTSDLYFCFQLYCSNEIELV